MARVKGPRQSLAWGILRTVTIALLLCATPLVGSGPDDTGAGIGARADALSGEAKSATPAARLLLPFYLVDTIDPNGLTTLFSLRNESSSLAVEVQVFYYRTDGPQAPQRTDTVVLQPKQILPINIRDVTGLEIDGSGMASGYVIIASSQGAKAIQGEYFRVTSHENYATGSRLLDIDPESTHNDLCNRFTVRFLNGGGFNSGTSIVVWTDLDVAPNGVVFNYTAYDEAGVPVLTSGFASNKVAFVVSAQDLLSSLPDPPDFGAIEIQFADGIAGHFSVVMSAEGRYSVGVAASCSDFP